MNEREERSGPWLVIGVGNRDRGDDGVGPEVCARLRARYGDERAPLRTFTCEGSIVDLAFHWRPDDYVAIVDAMAPGAAAGRTVTADVTDQPLSPPGAVSTHDVDVSVAIELARAIGHMPARLVLIGVEAGRVDWGTPLSEAVDAAADLVVDQLAELVGAPRQPAATVRS